VIELLKAEFIAWDILVEVSLDPELVVVFPIERLPYVD
jgi:hypothetical protein